MSRRSCDLFLDEHTGGLCLADPKHDAALKRRSDCGQPWAPMIVGGRDAGGRRDFLEGKAIHCGTGLELQAFEIRSDDYGEWRVWLQKGVRVRYEMEWDADRKGLLYADVAGHEFTKPIDSGMRFRWPAVRR